MKKVIAGGVIAILVILLVTNRNQGSKSEVEPIKIGVGAVFTGSLARFGEWIRQGTELAVADINAAGGVAGKPIELIYGDTKCSPVETNSVLRKFTSVNRVVAYIGPFCGSSLTAGARFSEDNDIIGITPNSNFGKISENFFSTQSLISDEPTAMAKFAYNELGLRRVAIYHYHNDWGILHKDTFVEVFEDIGGEITHIEATKDYNQIDHRTELTKIKATNPEAIYFGFSAIGVPVNQARELGMEQIFLSQFGAEQPELLDAAGSNAEGLIYTYRGTGESESKKQLDFKERYEGIYNQNPGLSVAESYDALVILTMAIESCSEFATQCIRDYLVSELDYDGVSGRIKIDPETYSVAKSIIIKTVENGEFVEYSLY